MTLEKLQSLPDLVLRQLAERLRIFFDEQMGKDDLAAVVLEAIAEDQEESVSALPKFWSELSKFDLGHDKIDLVDDVELQLPEVYNATYLLVMQRDPSWFYVLWDYSANFLSRWKLQQNSPLILRMGRYNRGPGGQLKPEYSTRIRVQLGERRHYVNLLWRQSGCCWAELCLSQPRPQPILRSIPFPIVSPSVSSENLDERQLKLLRISALQLEERPLLVHEHFQEAGGYY